MTLEKILCPICKSKMIKTKTTQSLVLNDLKQGDFEMPVDYMYCNNCHNLQTFIMMPFGDLTKTPN